MACGNKKCFDFAGQAKSRIIIQSRSESRTALGGQDVSWGTFATVWAKASPMSGREVFSAEYNQSRVTHKFLIRYQSGLKDTQTAADKRISFDGRLFNIKFIRNLDDDLKTEGVYYQELIAEEGKPDNSG